MLLGGAQTWSPHIEPYKFLLRILKSNSTAENYTVVRLGQVVHSSIFYNIWNSWLPTFHSFEFRFRRRHSENHQYFASTICFEAKRSIKTSKRVGKSLAILIAGFTVLHHRKYKSQSFNRIVLNPGNIDAKYVKTLPKIDLHRIFSMPNIWRDISPKM